MAKHATASIRHQKTAYKLCSLKTASRIFYSFLQTQEKFVLSSDVQMLVCRLVKTQIANTAAAKHLFLYTHTQIYVYSVCDGHRLSQLTGWARRDVLNQASARGNTTQERTRAQQVICVTIQHG